MFLTQSGGFIIKPISRLLGAILSLLYRGLNAIGVESIGIAIILFTLIVRLIIFPLMYKQNRSSKIMSMIQPEINKATKKYRGKTDQQSMMEVTNLENKTGSLADALRGADIFVGVSAPNIVTADMVKTMNKDAIIFAMANPVPEIMPDVAKAAGARVVGTGRSDFPNQVNNVIAFPGIFKGALEGRARQITEDMKLAAALAIANLVPDDEVSDVNILPEAFDPRVADVVSKAVIDHIEK